MLTAALLALPLGSPPVAPPHVNEPELPFDPVSAEVTVDDDGTMEILAFDRDGEIVGAMLTTPTEEHVQIDASFPDGYVSIVLVLAEQDPSMPLPQNLWTDLDPELVTARVTTMFEFVSPPRHGERGKRQCMFLLASTAAYCGVAAAFPPAGAIVVTGCFLQFANSLCACSEHIPIKVC